MIGFRRYTNLADLIYILRERKITLRDPKHWDDTNDSYYLKTYKEHNNLKTLLALCFADETGETYHHWRVFSSGVDGVSIKFDKCKILGAFRSECESQCVKPVDNPVDYVKIGNLKCRDRGVEDLPFLKWSPYGDEKEYRIVFADKDLHESWEFRIELDWIKHISLSPWLPIGLEPSVISTLRSVCGHEELSVSKSQVIDFAKWKEFADKIVGKIT